jgi:hypothetical protein
VAAVHDGGAEVLADAPVLTGGHVRRGRARRLLVLLPVLALGAGAAALAGVFDADNGAPAVDRAPAPHVQEPVTTPLPIKVKHKRPATPVGATASAGTASASASATAPSSTGTGTTAQGTGTTP